MARIFPHAWPLRYASRRRALRARGSVSVLFALSALPLLTLVGLGIDYGFWCQSYATLSMAADAAAMNAARVAVTGESQNDPNYVREGWVAGMVWFSANGGPYVNNATAKVTVSGTNIVTAQVQFTGTVPAMLGGFLLRKTTYQISGGASAVATLAPYLNVDILLDNSSSMDIGATPTDIFIMQEITACAPSGAYSGPDSSGNYIQPLSHQVYLGYQCSMGGHTYDGGLPCPITPPIPPATFSTYVPGTNFNAPGPSCQGWLPQQANGTYPRAGPPCAFACHFDTSKPAGTGNDFFGVARSTLGTGWPVTLRIDTVKTATNQVIAAMQSSNLAIDNLNVGIFAFNTTLTQVYPNIGEAGNDWAAAEAAVGTPPTAGNLVEQGIQPDTNGGSDTDFPDAMTGLATKYLTPAGDGTTASTPRKALFLITDGFQDYGTAGGGSSQQAFDPGYCAIFKNMGYTVYVVYTPYYPLMNYNYLNLYTGIVEGTGPGSLSYNLQACASAPSDYIKVSDAASLNAALQGFLKLALISPARFSM
jgi:Flp pilus assembly protein TadG